MVTGVKAKPGRPRTGIVIHCKVCGKERYVRQSFAKLGAKYCSQACAIQDPEWRDNVGEGTRLGHAVAEVPVASNPHATLVQQVIPKTLPEEVREEVSQSMLVALLSGEIKENELGRHVKRFIKNAFELFPQYGQGKPLSLDAPPSQDPEGQPLSERLGANDADLLDDISTPPGARIRPVTKTWKLVTGTGTPYTKTTQGYEANCSFCGKVIYLTQSVVADSFYCNRECRKQGGWFPNGRNGIVVRQCWHCGTDFKSYRYLEQRFCSRQCFYARRRGKQFKTVDSGRRCPECNEPILTRVGTGKTAKWCSQICRQKAWHKRVTAKQGCHWCGKPAAPGYKTICSAHLPFAKANTAKSKLRRMHYKRTHGICLSCFRRADLGYVLCPVHRQRNSLAARERRKQQREQRERQRVRRGLISVRDAALLLGFRRYQSIHWLIKRGELTVVERAEGRFWLRRSEVKAL